MAIRWAGLVLILLLATSTLAFTGVVHPMSEEQVAICHAERWARVSTLYNSADEIVPGVWVGSVCAARSESFLRYSDVALIAGTADEWFYEGLSPDNRTEYIAIPGLRDSPDEEDEGAVLLLFQHAVQRIQDWQARHSPEERRGGILIYCNMGISRSVSVALAYLMMTGQMPSVNTDPVPFIQAIRPSANPNWLYRQVLGKIYHAEHMSRQWL